MSLFNALLKKELLEAVRDKRGLMAAFLMAFLAPLVIYGVTQKAVSERTEKPEVYVTYTQAEAAPMLVKRLADEKILSIDAADEKQKARWQKKPIELIFPADFAEKKALGKPVDVILRADYSEQSIESAIRRIRNEIRNFNQSEGMKRLLVRGIDVNLMRPVDLQEQDTAPPQNNSGFVSMILQMYLIMAAFFCGVSIAIDTSAGERERDVLEMLLCQPVSTLQVVLAKLAAASIIAIVGVVMTLVFCSFAIGFSDLGKLGMAFSIDFNTGVLLLLLLLPISIFASALQLFMAFQAKSFKEAQSLVTFVIMVPAMLPMVIGMMNNKPTWMDYLPVTGQTLMMENIFKGAQMSYTALFTTGATTLVISAVLIYIMSIRLKSEKVVLSLS